MLITDHYQMLKTVVLLYIFVNTDILIHRKLKKRHLFKIKIYCNILKSILVTFEHFNAYLLNKSTKK